MVVCPLVWLTIGATGNEGNEVASDAMAACDVKAAAAALAIGVAADAGGGAVAGMSYFCT